MSFAGSRAIRSALSNNTYATLPVFTTGVSAPVVGRQRHNADSTSWPPLWNITSVGEGSNVYTIGDSPSFITIDRPPSDGMTVFFLNPPGPPGDFSIESAGDGLVRIHVPNVDRVWTLVDDGSDNPGFGTRITLEPDTGLQGQRWSLNDLD